MNHFAKLQEMVATTLNVSLSSIHETTTDKDIPAWDSLAQVNLMMSLEQTFNIQLDVEDFAHLNSIPAILDYLNKGRAE